MIKIKINCKTPTVNHLYWHKGNIKILTSQAKKIRKYIEEICQEIKIDEIDEIRGKKLKVSIKINENWLNKIGTAKKKDIANREKFLIDSVFKAMEIDDKFIWKFEAEKVQDDEDEFAEVEITEWQERKKQNEIM